MSKKKNNWAAEWAKNHKIILFSIIIVLILFFVFGFKLLLYIKLILGNDIIVKLEADKQNIYLAHGDEEEIEFHAKATTNLFCAALCVYSFTDISMNNMIDKDNFTLSPAMPLNKKYIVSPPKFGSGLYLYRFDIECSSKRTLLCHTKEEPSTRSILVTLNYDLSDEEKKLKQGLKEEIIGMAEEMENLRLHQLYLEEIYTQISQVIIFENKTEKTQKDINSLEKYKGDLEDTWKKQDYRLLAEKTKETRGLIIETKEEFNETEQNLIELAGSYNELIGRLYGARETLEDIRNLTITNETQFEEINNTINDFNDALEILSQMAFISEKEILIDGILQKVEYLNISIREGAAALELAENETTDVNENETTNVSAVNLTLSAIKEININNIEAFREEPTQISIELEEPKPECCVFGKCQDCCITEQCKKNHLNLPVVFIHGHAIDKSTSAGYSLEGFNKIQERLEEDGYLNAGTVTLYTLKDTPQGIWGLPPVPLTIRTSYYFDVFEEPQNYIVIQTKSENIDTYSIRLKELIDTIKYKTGRPKVNIIAFSMGGLVTRRYIQIFGTDSIGKVILIGTPNKGIVGRTLELCPIVGESLECNDMNSKSLFINKLNRQPLPKISIYNILGTGCGMSGEEGDGAVLEKNALLDGARNYIINGTCRSIGKPLHLELRDIDLYPEVYRIIREALKN